MCYETETCGFGLRETLRRQQLYRFQPMRECNLPLVTDDMRQVAEEGHAGHLCAVAILVMVIGAPVFIDGMAVVLCERLRQQRMCARYTGIQTASCWCCFTSRRNPPNEVLKQRYAIFRQIVGVHVRSIRGVP